MNRKQRREAAQKKAEFVERMRQAKCAKRLVVPQRVIFPDAQALALVAKWKQERRA